MKVILMHGKDTSPQGKWYPWFREQVEDLGYEFLAPTLPKPSDPVLSEWMAELDKLTPGSETMLIGHSRGGVAVLRWLEQAPTEIKVYKVVLIATNSGLLVDRFILNESNHGFYTEQGYNFTVIKKHCDDFTVLHSRDDKWVPFAHGEKNASGLDANFLAFDGYGHFGKGIDEIPELLELIRRD